MPCGLRPHATAVRGNEAVAEVEAEAGAPHGAGGLGAVAPTEKLRQLASVETDAFVANAHRRGRFIRGHRYRDRRMLRRVLHGVGHEIRDDLLDPALIPLAYHGLLGAHL